MQGQTASYILTTLVTRPASAALTTLANVKDELDIKSGDTSNDDRLNRWINEESADIARYCNRIFGLATWVDEFRPQRGVLGEGVRASTNPLKLSKYPLANAAAVVFTGNTHASISVDGIASTAGIAPGQLIAAMDGSIPSGTTVKRVNPNSLVLSKPASGSALGLSMITGINVVETVAGVSTWLKAGTDFEIQSGSLLPGDEGVGLLYRLNDHGNPKNWPASTIQVTYQSGYTLPDCECSNLPSDLEKVCIRLVVGRYAARGRDPMLVERNQPGNIGTERWWIGATPGQRGPYPNDLMSTLDSYRTPVVG
jgi:hypothetical protein